MTGENSTVYQNLWDITKIVTTGKFITPSAHIYKLERHQIIYQCM